MILEDLGQKIENWAQEWERLSPESEIRMWDYYGLRKWILKYTPRYGKVLEAGCGLGRYVFYLSKFGIDITGLDFSEKTINFLKKWQKKHHFNLNFITGDVTKLDIEDNSLSGYLSFGVVEHFIEGPQKALNEAFRVLKPGGIAIVTTPAPSWFVVYSKKKKILRRTIKRLLGKKVGKKPFFQYEYSPKVLKHHLSKQGFFISRSAGTDIMYTFTELGGYTDKYLREKKIGYFLSHILENSFFSFLGAQSVVIGIKLGDVMSCFMCGNNKAKIKSLERYDIPICNECQKVSNSEFYLKENCTRFHNQYLISPPILNMEERHCEFCGNAYETDQLFEDFGLDKNVCQICLRNKDYNINLSNSALQPIWRARSSK